MDAELQRIYDETPEQLPASRLEPFKELIFRWRRDGRSYPAICTLLQIQCGVQISKQCLRRYVLRRARKRRPDALGSQPEVKVVAAAPAQTVASKRTAAEKAALRMAAKACYHKSTVVHKEHQELFVFDEEKPLTNKPEEKTWQQQK